MGQRVVSQRPELVVHPADNAICTRATQCRRGVMLMGLFKKINHLRIRTIRLPQEVIDGAELILQRG